MKTKTSELQGAALDWAVAKCENHEIGIIDKKWIVFDSYQGDPPLSETPNETPNYYNDARWQRFRPTADWAQGGPIIERERICLLDQGGDNWQALWGWKKAFGPTPLIAAMRCFVASRLGDEVEIPEELL